MQNVLVFMAINYSHDELRKNIETDNDFKVLSFFVLLC